MSALKVGVHLIPVTTQFHSGEPRERCGTIDIRKARIVEAEVLEINPRFCRLRVPRDCFSFDPADVDVQFAWTDVLAHIIWTNTRDDFVELGLLMPEASECKVASTSAMPEQEAS